MNWKFWRPAAPTASRPHERSQPFLVLELQPNGSVDAIANLPDDEETARRFAAMLYFLNIGKMLPLIQNAVSLGGAMSRQEKGFDSSLIVLNGMNEMMEGVRSTKQGKLCVSPQEAFNPKPHGVQLND